MRSASANRSSEQAIEEKGGEECRAVNRLEQRGAVALLLRCGVGSSERPGLRYHLCSNRYGAGEMLAGIIFRVDRALGKERLRNERDAARYDSKEYLRERDEYHRQLDVALGERNQYLRQRDALLEQIERERARNSTHDLVSALADALARMTVQRDDLRRERDEIKRELENLTSRVIEPDARSMADD